MLVQFQPKKAKASVVTGGKNSVMQTLSMISHKNARHLQSQTCESVTLGRC